MNDLVKKYFSDLPGSEDYPGINTLYPPANPARIVEVEKALSVKFPQDYIDFLQITNGYEGKLGDSYSIFIQIDKIEKYTKDYGEKFFPWIVFIGTDGGNEMYVIDKRKKLQFGILPYIGDKNDFIALGDTFEEFIKRLYHNDFWEIKKGGDKNEYKGT